jgi:hypothetical protein
MENDQAKSDRPAARRIAVQIVTIWLALRTLTSLLAAVFSPLRPLTALERAVPLWPPSGNLPAWLERALVAPWLRWDGVWFTRIVTRGYAAGDGTASFHPLYPWLSIPLHRLGVDPTLSLLITASLACLALLWVFQRLAGLDLNPAQTGTALLCLATFPVAFILFAPYTEGLFLLLTALTLLFARQGRPLATAGAAFLAALTRQQGVFLLLPVAWGAWEASGRSLRGLKRAWGAWLAVLAAPAGLAAWSVYRLGVLHEGKLDFQDLQGLVYSALISPAAHQVVPVQSFLWPWQALWIAVSKAVHAPDVDILVNLALGIGFVLALLAAWPHLKIGERLYSLAITLISFSLSSGPIHPYISLPRHLFLALPVFVGLGAVLTKPWHKLLVIIVQVLAMLLLLLLYVLEAWIP